LEITIGQDKIYGWSAQLLFIEKSITRKFLIITAYGGNMFELALLQLAHLAEEAEMEQFYMELKELHQQLSAYFPQSLKMSFTLILVRYPYQVP
jgi:hypothetical protein